MNGDVIIVAGPMRVSARRVRQSPSATAYEAASEAASEAAYVDARQWKQPERETGLVLRSQQHNMLALDREYVAAQRVRDAQGEQVQREREAQLQKVLEDLSSRLSGVEGFLHEFPTSMTSRLDALDQIWSVVSEASSATAEGVASLNQRCAVIEDRREVEERRLEAQEMRVDELASVRQELKGVQSAFDALIIRNSLSQSKLKSEQAILMVEQSKMQLALEQQQAKLQQQAATIEALKRALQSGQVSGNAPGAPPAVHTATLAATSTVQMLSPTDVELQAPTPVWAAEAFDSQVASSASRRPSAAPTTHKGKPAHKGKRRGRITRQVTRALNGDENVPPAVGKAAGWGVKIQNLAEKRLGLRHLATDGHNIEEADFVDVHIEESMWGATLLIATEHLGPITSAYVLFLAVFNVSMQTVQSPIGPKRCETGGTRSIARSRRNPSVEMG